MIVCQGYQDTPTRKTAREQCSCRHCKQLRTRNTVYLTAIVGFKVSEPLPTEVTGSVAAVTHSKVSKPTAVAEPELPASEHAFDSSAQASAPVAHLSDCQQRYAAAYDKDLAFQDESQLSLNTSRPGLWWSPEGRLVILDADALRQSRMCKMHDSPA